MNIESMTIAEVCEILGISSAYWASEKQDQWFIGILGRQELSCILGDYMDQLHLYPEDVPVSREECLAYLSRVVTYKQAITKAKEAACASI